MPLRGRLPGDAVPPRCALAAERGRLPAAPRPGLERLGRLDDERRARARLDRRSTSTATAWPRNFGPAFVDPLRKLAGTTIDLWAIVWGILLPGSIGDRYVGLLKKHLLGDATLQDLPDRPRFVINATNLQSAVLLRFSKPYMRDYRVGEIKAPTTALATARSPPPAPSRRSSHR